MASAERSAADLLRAGELQAAVAAQTEIVRARPLDPDARYLLCGLFALNGDWQRAAKQLSALGVNDPELKQRSAAYHNLLGSEAARQAVFAGETEPLMPPDPPAHALRRLAAVQALAAGDGGTAAAELEVAVGEQPELAGNLNDRPFGAARDLDDLLGSVLEIFAGGRYLWLPLESIRRLEIEEPRHLMDTIWLPAELVDSDGSTATVHLPVLYAGSAGHESDTVRLGRETRWEEVAPEVFAGRGQRIMAFATEGEPKEVPVLDLRKLEVAGG